jgi:excisionase family DNA binding protein
LTRIDVMRAADVAALLGLPLSTIHEWARQGRLPSRKRGRHRLFLRSEVEAWLTASDEA